MSSFDWNIIYHINQIYKINSKKKKIYLFISLGLLKGATGTGGGIVEGSLRWQFLQRSIKNKEIYLFTILLIVLKKKDALSKDSLAGSLFA